MLSICHVVRVALHEIRSIASHGLVLDTPYKQKKRGGVVGACGQGTIPRAGVPWIFFFLHFGSVGMIYLGLLAVVYLSSEVGSDRRRTLTEVRDHVCIHLVYENRGRVSGHVLALSYTVELSEKSRIYWAT